MNELRRSLLDDSATPPELPPELRFLAARQASMGALLIDHAELYKLLLARFREDGPADELQAIALDAAGNLATVLQSMRAHEDWLLALKHSPLTESFPSILIDQLVYSFALLAAPSDEEWLASCLEPEDLDALIATDRMQAWLKGVGADTAPSGPLSSRFGLEPDGDDA
jgi:hypothetical protein